MEYVLPAVGLVLAAAGVIAAMVIIAGAASVFAMSRTTVALLDADDQPRVYRKTAALARPEWLDAEGFSPAGAYRVSNPMMSVELAAWQHPVEPIYICVYLLPNGQKSMDIVTLYSDDMALTTGTNRDGHTLPTSPGTFMQTFSNDSIESLWRKHLEAEQALIRYLRSKPSPTSMSFAEAIQDGMASQAGYVRSLPAWPLRMPYWFFVRRFRLHNKTVEEQLHTTGAYRA